MSTKHSAFSSMADFFGLPVHVIEIMYKKGVITDRITDSDKEFIFKYRQLWLNAQILRTQMRRLSKKDREDIIESISIPEMTQAEKWAYKRWWTILSDQDQIPPRVYKIAEEIQLHFKVENYLVAEDIAKRMKRVAYDRIRYGQKKEREG